MRGHALEYRSWGPRDGPALVLLHEGLGSVSLWRDFPARLAARTGRRVVAYSRSGHGHSDPVSLPRSVRFMHDEALDELPAVLDALALDRATLVGHSDGGSIALIFAGAHPSRVESLVLEAPHVFVEALSLRSIRRMRDEYATAGLRGRLARHHGANVDVAFRGWNDVWLDPAFRTWSIADAVARVKCPILVLQGELDEYGTPAQVLAIHALAAGPVESLLLQACGHSPHRDQPEAVLTETERFLGRYAQRVHSTAG
ncbi:MAG: alpha/beta hydrolase [Acidobacteriota bacterium]